VDYWGRESVKTVETVLRKAGFTVSQACCSRPSCFDFAARRSEDLVLVKVHPDIGSLSKNDAKELGTISEYLSAASLLVTKKAREKPLEDDTVYSRYNTPTVTPMTFENIVLRDIQPLIQANPGGCYVEIDGESLKRRRQELGLSAGELTKMIGISRRTLYGYERGMAKASVTTAYNLVWALGIPVAKPVDIFEKSKPRHKCFLLSTAKRVITGNRLLYRIFKKLGRADVATVKKAPFDFVIDVPKERMKIIGGVAIDKEQELDKRIDEILSVSKIIRAHPIFITEGKEPANKEIQCINSEDVSRIKNPEDLIAGAT
jgi:putative transcriptional regulator